MSQQDQLLSLGGYLHLTFPTTLLTGMHIGGGQKSLAIGVVDKTIIRDPLTQQPIIPGSSIKGKLRSLMVRQAWFEAEHPPTKSSPNSDPPQIRRLFGDTEEHKMSALMFEDARLTPDSLKFLEKADTDLYLTEIKFENSIDRLTSQANPRQLERLPAGSVFSVRITYRLLIDNSNQVLEDLRLLAGGLDLLQSDYLGGHGSRGYGRVALTMPTIETRASGEMGTMIWEEVLPQISKVFESVCAQPAGV